jgi:hypothetical protein
MAFGVGWIFFETAEMPIDWAIIRSNHHPTCLKRTASLMRRYAPVVVVLEEFDREPTCRVARIQKLCRALIKLAEENGIATGIYSQTAVRSCFSAAGARYRHQIAQAIADRFEVLRPKLPPRRKFPMDQDMRIAIFNAAACALTHYAATTK